MGFCTREYYAEKSMSVFSSPEHKVLKGSFEGGDESVVRRQQFL